MYGQPGSGKSTLGRLLADYMGTPFFIDGDEFRAMFENKNYGKEGRELNIRQANAVATYLNKKAISGDWAAVYCREKESQLKGLSLTDKTNVVLSLVNPYQYLREELVSHNQGQVVEVLLKSKRELRREFHAPDFQEGSPDFVLNTDEPADKTFTKLIEYIKSKKK